MGAFLNCSSLLLLIFESLNKQIFLNKKWDSSGTYRNESKEILIKVFNPVP